MDSPWNSPVVPLYRGQGEGNWQMIQKFIGEQLIGYVCMLIFHCINHHQSLISMKNVLGFIFVCVCVSFTLLYNTYIHKLRTTPHKSKKTSSSLDKAPQVICLHLPQTDRASSNASPERRREWQGFVQPMCAGKIPSGNLTPENENSPCSIGNNNAFFIHGNQCFSSVRKFT